MNRSLCIAVFCIGLCTSCLETEISLKPADYKLIDSLYTQKKDSIAPFLESKCLEYQDSILLLWVDSIRQKRESEIQQLISKEKKDEK